MVTGASKTSTYATLRTYQKNADGTWSAKFAAMPARNGAKGWVVAARRVQDTGTTPQGTFRITTAFGLKKNPGTKVAYRLADGNDYWVGDQRDPKTYNLVQPSASAKRTWRTGEAETPCRLPDAVRVRRGDRLQPPGPGHRRLERQVLRAHHQPAGRTSSSGRPIFLHINGKGATAGCVSMQPGQHDQRAQVARPGQEAADRDGAPGGDRHRLKPDPDHPATALNRTKGEIHSTGPALPPTVIAMFAPGLQLPSSVAPACVHVAGADTRI